MFPLITQLFSENLTKNRVSTKAMSLTDGFLKIQLAIHNEYRHRWKKKLLLPSLSPHVNEPYKDGVPATANPRTGVTFLHAAIFQHTKGNSVHPRVVHYII